MVNMHVGREDRVSDRPNFFENLFKEPELTEEEKELRRIQQEKDRIEWEKDYQAMMARRTILKFQCPICKETVNDPDERIVDPERESPLRELKCEKCIEKEEIDKRYEEFIKKVPIIHRENLDISVNENIISQRNCIIYGPYGTGKTHLAYSLAKKLWMNYSIKNFDIVREINIINELRNNALAGRDYKNTDLLVIDEFGKVNDTDFTKAQIFDIIDFRNDWDKKTVLICNAKNNEELAKIIPIAIQDRFKKCVILLDGKTKR